MKMTRTLSASGGKCVLGLPRRTCLQEALAPGSRIRLLLEAGNGPTGCALRVRRGGRGLRITVPAWWCRYHGLRAGAPVMLLVVEPGVFGLQPVEGASGKELLRLGNALAFERVRQAEEGTKAAYEAGVRHGRSLGYCQAYGEFSRRRECFNPDHSRSENNPHSVPETITEGPSDEPPRE